MGQALLKAGFEESGSKQAVHLETRANNLLGTIIKPSCLPGVTS